MKRENWLTCQNHLMHRYACDRLVAWKKKLCFSEDEIHKMELEIGLSFELEAEHQQGRLQKDEGVKAHFLEMALQHYISIGETVKFDELKYKIKKARLQAEAAYKPIKIPLDISKEEIDYILDIYRDEQNLNKILDMFRTDPDLIINTKEMREISKRMISTRATFALMPTSGISGGRVVSHQLRMKRNWNFYFNIIILFK